MLGGPGGVGKSVKVAALEVAIASGKPFLEAEVQQGTVLHLDFDTDARLQGPWYARVAKGMGGTRRGVPPNPLRGPDRRGLALFDERTSRGAR